MKFYTSYFDNYKNIPDTYQCISIARFPPDIFKHPPVNCNRLSGDLLAPSAELLSDIKSGKITEDEYTTRYVNELAISLNNSGYHSFKDYFNAIVNMYENQTYTKWDGIIFFCYEKPGEFCHRHILSKIINKIGYTCEE